MLVVVVAGGGFVVLLGLTHCIGMAGVIGVIPDIALPGDVAEGIVGDGLGGEGLGSGGVGLGLVFYVVGIDSPELTAPGAGGLPADV